MNRKTMIAFGLAAGLALALALGATTDRPGGQMFTVSCNPTNPIASQTDLVVCAFDMPMAATLASAQLECGVTGTTTDWKVIEGAATVATAALTTALDPLFFTITDASFADEAEVNVAYTTGVGETASACNVLLVFYP